MNNTAEPTIHPITDADITAVADFLHQHMNSQFSSQEWEQGINACWLKDAPNHGFMLQANNKIVGVICAIYSLQQVKGSEERFCNPHTWCVLEPYRKKSVALVLSVICQEGFHFTMFSPNKEGEQIFNYLGFKPLNQSQLILPHCPSFKCFRSNELLTPNQMAEQLPSLLKKYYQDHQPYPWVQPLAFHSGSEYCLIFYTRGKYKKLPCANITYISNKNLFLKHWGPIKNHLLFKQGICLSRIDKRMLPLSPMLSFKTVNGHPRFYLSKNLDSTDIEYIYSELVVMNL